MYCEARLSVIFVLSFLGVRQYGERFTLTQSMDRKEDYYHKRARVSCSAKEGIAEILSELDTPDVGSKTSASHHDSSAKKLTTERSLQYKDKKSIKGTT